MGILKNHKPRTVAAYFILTAALVALPFSAHALVGSGPLEVMNGEAKLNCSDGQILGVRAGETSVSCMSGFTQSVLDAGATCDGSTDDGSTINDLVDDMANNGGGTIIIPDGSTCATSTDIQIHDGVSLQCLGDGGLKAISGGSFTQGLVELTNASTNSGIYNCALDLNSIDTVNGIRMGTVVGAYTLTAYANTISNFPSTSGANVYGISTGTILSTNGFSIEFNRLVGSATSGAGNIGIYTNSSGGRINGNTLTDMSKGGVEVDVGAPVNQPQVTGNNFRSNVAEFAYKCTNNSTSFIGNNATSNADGFIAIDACDSAVVSSNNILLTGDDAFAVKADEESTVTGNVIALGGDGSVGVQAEGGYVAISSNTIVSYSGTDFGTNLTAIYDGGNVAVAVSGNTIYFALTSTGGTGIRLGGVGSSATVNAIRSLEDDTVMASASGGQQYFTGNNITGGGWGIVPDQLALTKGVNTRVSNNNIYGLENVGIIIETGWHVVGNTVNYGGSNYIPILIGDNRTYGGCTQHSIISANSTFCSTCDVGVRVTDIGERCDGGTADMKECNTSSGQTACTSGGGTCETVTCSAVAFTGNQVLVPNVSGALGLDLGTDSTDYPLATAPKVTDWVISGNQFNNGSGATASIGFGASRTADYSDIQIGINEFSDSPSSTIENWDDGYGRDWMKTPTACTGSQFATGIDSDGDMVCGTPSAGASGLVLQTVCSGGTCDDSAKYIGHNAAIAAVSDYKQASIPVAAGTLDKLICNNMNTGGGRVSGDYEIAINGTANTSTTVTFSGSGGVQSASFSVSVSDGDVIAIEPTSASGATSATRLSCSVYATPS